MKFDQNDIAMFETSLWPTELFREKLWSLTVDSLHKLCLFWFDKVKLFVPYTFVPCANVQLKREWHKCKENVFECKDISEKTSGVQFSVTSADHSLKEGNIAERISRDIKSVRKKWKVLNNYFK